MGITNVSLEEINNAIFQSADSVFPELSLERCKSGWRSSKKLDGSPSRDNRKDKTVITSGRNRLLEQGGETLSFWDYIGRREGIREPKEIYKKLASLAGFELQRSPRRSEKISIVPKDVKQEKTIESYATEQLLESAHSYFLEQMRLNSAAEPIKDYLQNSRKYLEDDIQRMELGVIPSQDALFTHLKTIGFTSDETAKLKLIRPIGETHQLVIPLRCKGKIVSFGFRDINHSAESKNSKYMNVTGFSKSKYLFNLPAGAVEGNLVLVEGELDALFASAHGIFNVAAIKGSSSLSPEQLELIKNAKPTSVVLCFDSDSAGAEAREKIKEQLLSEGLACAEAILPEGFDPDRYIKTYNAEALFNLLNSAEPIQPSKIKGLDTSCSSFQDLETRLLNRPDALKTGYASLDEDIRIPVGAITLIAGRPRHGKTTVLYNLLLSMADIYPEKKFYFFSYEESEADILLKILNRLTAADLKIYGHVYEGAITNLHIIEKYIKDKHTNIKEIEKGKEKLDALLESGRIQILDLPHKVEILTAIIETANKRENIGAVFIDYIQRVGTKEILDIRASMVRVSDELRKLAVTTGLPLLIGAQFGREGVGKKNEDQTASKPSLQALKEAGNLEEDANLVLRVWNEAVESNDSSAQVSIEIAALKSRSGNPSAKASLSFKPQLGLLEDFKMQSNFTGQVANRIRL
jgi:DNA primase catalytic core